MLLRAPLKGADTAAGDGDKRDVPVLVVVVSNKGVGGVVGAIDIEDKGSCYWSVVVVDWAWN
jgi:inorganic pyrophosphatase